MFAQEPGSTLGRRGIDRGRREPSASVGKERPDTPSGASPRRGGEDRSEMLSTYEHDFGQGA